MCILRKMVPKIKTYINVHFPQTFVIKLILKTINVDDEC